MDKLRLRILCVMAMAAITFCCALTAQESFFKEPVPAIKKVLFIGDSQTGWMGERLTAYGAENGFEVATITWDGATPQKYAKSGKLPTLIATHKPDVVFINLGMNELLERNPQTSLGPSMTTIKRALGDIPFVWVGPLSWPGKGKGETLVTGLKRQWKVLQTAIFIMLPMK